MKKTTCLIIAVLICFGILTGCSQGSTELRAENGALYGIVEKDVFSLDVGVYNSSFVVAEPADEYTKVTLPCIIYVSSFESADTVTKNYVVITYLDGAELYVMHYQEDGYWSNSYYS